MQRTIMILCLLLFITAPAFAARSVPNTVLFVNATSIGAGTSFWVKNNGVIDWTCDFEITGSPSAVTVRIEGNTGDIEGTSANESLTFDPTGMATHVITADQLSAGKASFGIINSAIKYIRGYIVTLTGGSSPTVSGQCGGIQP